MKAQHSLPRVQAGVTAKRRPSPKVRDATRTAPARRPRAKHAAQEQGTGVLWLLMVVGAMVATGFIFALRAQHTVHQLDQAETQLRNDLDRISAYQRHLTLEQQRALSVRESEQMAKQSGLIQPKMPPTQLAARPTKPATTAASAKPATTSVKPATSSRLTKPAAASAKSVLTAKPAAKSAKSTASAKPAAKSAKSATATSLAKLKKENPRPQSRGAQRR